MDAIEFENQFKHRLAEITETSRLGEKDSDNIAVIMGTPLPAEMYYLAMMAKGHKINLNHLFGID